MTEVSIYTITDLISGKCYVGSTVNPKRRFATHRQDLNKGTHTAKRLQNSWRKYGADQFSFEVIEICNEADRIIREQYHIDNRKPFFNWVRTVRSPALDPRVRKQISKAMQGNQRTKGLKWSAEARVNMSKAVKGKPRSPAQRAATLRSLELARQKNRVNKPGMNWRILREKEQQCELPL